MRNIYLLAKNYFLCAVGSLRGKKSKLKSSMGLLIIVLGIAALFGFLQYSALMQASMFNETHQVPMELILYLGYFMGIFISLIFIIQKVTGGQRANDAELLMSMPFKKSEIVIAKAISRYLFNLGLVLMFILPYVIAYFVYVPFRLASLLGCIITLFVIPLFSVGISYLFDYLSTVLFPTSKISNIIKTLLSIALIFGFVFIYEFIIINPENQAMMNFNLSIIGWLVNFNPIFILSFIAICFGVFILGTYLFSRTLNKQNNKEKSKKIDLSGRNSTTPFKSLLKNEVNRYTNSTVLMINSIIGPIGIIAITIWLMFDKGAMLQQLGTAIGIPTLAAPLFIAIIFCFMSIMTYPSAFSISLEGKQFWILKTMPIKTSSILLSKSLFNVNLFTPLSIICSVLLVFTVKMDVFVFLTILFVPILLNIIISFGGVLINLLFPKFDSESDVAVVKQSMSGFIMLFCGFILIFLIALPVWFMLDNGVSIQLVFLFSTLIPAIIAGIMIALTFTVGKRIFNRL